MRLDIRQAQIEHCEALAAMLRSHDLDELRLNTTMPPDEAVRYSLHVSVAAWTWIVDGEVAAMFGVIARSAIDDCAMPWILTTSHINRRSLTFLRMTRAAVAHMLRLYPHLEGFVDAAFPISIRWLRWLGFTVHSEEPVLLNDLNYYRFEKRRS